MKLKNLALLLSLIMLLFAACKKGYYSDNNRKNNNNDYKIKWDWSGTPPLSAKINGKLFVANDTESYSQNNGIITIVGKSSESSNFETDTSISIRLVTGFRAGDILTLSPSYNIYVSYGEYRDCKYNVSDIDPAKILIYTYTTEILEGKFYGTLKNPYGHSVEIKEGYFKFDLTKKTK